MSLPSDQGKDRLEKTISLIQFESVVITYSSSEKGARHRLDIAAAATQVFKVPIGLFKHRFRAEAIASYSPGVSCAPTQILHIMIIFNFN